MPIKDQQLHELIKSITGYSDFATSCKIVEISANTYLGLKRVQSVLCEQTNVNKAPTKALFRLAVLLAKIPTTIAVLSVSSATWSVQQLKAHSHERCRPGLCFSNGTARLKKFKQLFKYQHLLLLRDIWCSGWKTTLLTSVLFIFA